jgi:hypothetical protein
MYVLTCISATAGRRIGKFYLPEDKEKETIPNSLVNNDGNIQAQHPEKAVSIIGVQIRLSASLFRCSGSSPNHDAFVQPKYLLA